MLTRLQAFHSPALASKPHDALGTGSLALFAASARGPWHIGPLPASLDAPLWASPSHLHVLPLAQDEMNRVDSRLSPE